MASYWDDEMDTLHVSQSSDDTRMLRSNDSISVCGGGRMREEESDEESEATVKGVMSDENLVGVRSFFFPMRDKIEKKRSRSSIKAERIEEMVLAEINNFNEGKKMGKQLDRIEKIRKKMTTREEGNRCEELEAAFEKHSMAIETLTHLRRMQERQNGDDGRFGQCEGREKLIDSRDVENINIECLKSYEKEVSDCKSKIACLQGELTRNKRKAEKTDVFEHRCKKMNGKIKELEDVISEKEAKLEQLAKERMNEKVEARKQRELKAKIAAKREKEVKNDIEESHNDALQRRKEMTGTETGFAGARPRVTSEKQRRERNARIYRNVQIEQSDQSRDDLPKESASCEKKKGEEFLKEKTEVIEVLTADMEQMKNEYENAKSKLNEKVKVAKRKCKDSEKEKEDLEKRLGWCEADNSNLQQSLQDTTAENIKLKEDLEKSLKRHESLRERLKNKRREKIDAEKINASNEIVPRRKKSVSFDLGADDIRETSESSCLELKTEPFCCMQCVSKGEEVSRLEAENKRLYDTLPKLEEMHSNLAKIADTAIERQAELKQENHELRRSLIISGLHTRSANQCDDASGTETGAQIGTQACFQVDTRTVMQYRSVEGRIGTRSDRPSSSDMRKSVIYSRVVHAFDACSDHLESVKDAAFGFQSFARGRLDEERESLHSIAIDWKVFKMNMELEQSKQESKSLRKELEMVKEFGTDLKKHNSELEIRLNNISVNLKETIENEEKARKQIRKLKRLLKLERLKNSQSSLENGLEKGAYVQTTTVIEPGAVAEKERETEPINAQDNDHDMFERTQRNDDKQQPRDEFWLPHSQRRQHDNQSIQLAPVDTKCEAKQFQAKREQQSVTRQDCFESQGKKGKMRIEDSQFTMPVAPQNIQPMEKQMLEGNEESGDSDESGTSTVDDTKKTLNTERTNVRSKDRTSEVTGVRSKGIASEVIGVRSKERASERTNVKSKEEFGEESWNDNESDDDTFDESDIMVQRAVQADSQPKQTAQNRTQEGDPKVLDEWESSESDAIDRNYDTENAKTHKKQKMVKMENADEESSYLNNVDLRDNENNRISIEDDSTQEETMSSLDKLRCRSSLRAKYKQRNSNDFENNFEEESTSVFGGTKCESRKSSLETKQSDSQTNLIKIQNSGILRKEKYKKINGEKKKKMKLRIPKLFPKLLKRKSSGEHGRTEDEKSGKETSVEGSTDGSATTSEGSRKTERIGRRALPERYTRNCPKRDVSRKSSEDSSKTKTEDSSSTKSSGDSNTLEDESSNVETGSTEERTSSQDNECNEEEDDEDDSDEDVVCRRVTAYSQYEEGENSNTEGSDEGGNGQTRDKDQMIKSTQREAMPRRYYGDEGFIVPVSSQGSMERRRRNRKKSFMNKGFLIKWKGFGSKKKKKSGSEELSDDSDEEKGDASEEEDDEDDGRKKAGAKKDKKKKSKGNKADKKMKKEEEKYDKKKRKEEEKMEKMKRKEEKKEAKEAAKLKKEQKKLQKKVDKNEEKELKKTKKEELKLAKKQEKENKKSKKEGKAKSDDKKLKGKEEKKRIRQDIKIAKEERKKAEKERKKAKEETKKQVKEKEKEEKKKKKEEIKKVKEMNAAFLKEKKRKEKEMKQEKKKAKKKETVKEIKKQKVKKVPNVENFKASSVKNEKPKENENGPKEQPKLKEVSKTKDGSVEKAPIKKASVAWGNAFNGQKTDEGEKGREEDVDLKKEAAQIQCSNTDDSAEKKDVIGTEPTYEPVTDGVVELNGGTDGWELDDDDDVDDYVPTRETVVYGQIPMRKVNEGKHDFMSTLANIVENVEQEKDAEIIEIDTGEDNFDKKNSGKDIDVPGHKVRVFEEEDIGNDIVAFTQDVDSDSEIEHAFLDTVPKKQEMHAAPQTNQVKVMPKLENEVEDSGEDKEDDKVASNVEMPKRVVKDDGSDKSMVMKEDEGLRTKARGTSLDCKKPDVTVKETSIHEFGDWSDDDDDDEQEPEIFVRLNDQPKVTEVKQEHVSGREKMSNKITAKVDATVKESSKHEFGEWSDDDDDEEPEIFVRSNDQPKVTEGQLEHVSGREKMSNKITAKVDATVKESSKHEFGDWSDDDDDEEPEIFVRSNDQPKVTEGQLEHVSGGEKMSNEVQSFARAELEEVPKKKDSTSLESEFDWSGVFSHGKTGKEIGDDKNQTDEDKKKTMKAKQETISKTRDVDKKTEASISFGSWDEDSDLEETEFILDSDKSLDKVESKLSRNWNSLGKKNKEGKKQGSSKVVERRNEDVDSEEELLNEIESNWLDPEPKQEKGRRGVGGTNERKDLDLTNDKEEKLMDEILELTEENDETTSKSSGKHRGRNVAESKDILLEAEEELMIFGETNTKTDSVDCAELAATQGQTGGNSIQDKGLKVVETAKKEVRAAKATAKAAKLEAEDLKERLNEKNKEIQRLKMEMERKFEEERILNEEKIKQAQSCRGVTDEEELKLELSVSNLQVKEQEKKLLDYEQKMKEYEREIMKYREESEEMKLLEDSGMNGKNIEAMKDRIAELEINEEILGIRDEELIKCRKEIAALRSNEDALREKLVEFEFGNLTSTVKGKEMESVVEENKSLKEKLEEMEMRLISMDAGDKNDIEVAEIKFKLEATEKRMKTLQTENERLKVSSKKDDANFERERCEREAKDLREKVSKMEKEKGDILEIKRQQSADAAEKLEASNKLVQTLQGEIIQMKKMKVEGEAEKEEIEKLKERNDKLANENQVLWGDVSKLKTQMESMKMTIEVLQQQGSETSEKQLEVGEKSPAITNWCGEQFGDFNSPAYGASEPSSYQQQQFGDFNSPAYGASEPSSYQQQQFGDFNSPAYGASEPSSYQQQQFGDFNSPAYGTSEPSSYQQQQFGDFNSPAYGASEPSSYQQQQFGDFNSPAYGASEPSAYQRQQLQEPTQEEPNEVEEDEFGAELEAETFRLDPDDFDFEALGTCNTEPMRVEKEVYKGASKEESRKETTLASKAVDSNDPFSAMSLMRRSVLSRPKSCDPEALRRELSIGQPARITLDEGEKVGYPTKKERKTKKRSKKVTSFMLTPSEKTVKFDGAFQHFNALPSIGKKK